MKKKLTTTIALILFSALLFSYVSKVYTKREIRNFDYQEQINSLASPDMSTRLAAIDELVSVGSISIGPCIEALSSTNLEQRISAANVLTKIGELAIQPLLKTLSNQDEQVTDLADYALCSMQPVPVIEIGEWLGEGRNPFAEYQLLLFLSKLGSTAAPAVPGITRLLSSELPKIRNASIVTLAEIGFAHPSVVEGLAILAENDEKVELRIVGCQALASLGQGANAALPTLQRLTQSNDSELAKIADITIKVIQGQPIPSEWPFQ